MTEGYFDVVNENNEAIGQEVRRIIHNSGLRHRGMHVFLFTSDRRLLVQKRSQTRDTFPGTLDCSVSENLKIRRMISDSRGSRFAGKVGGRGHSSHSFGSIQDELWAA